MQRLMNERNELGVVDDQIGAPTWCRAIAEPTAALLAQVLRGGTAIHATRGHYHLGPAGEPSWHGFAATIGELLELDCEVRAITTADYPTPVVRPANSRMDSFRIEEV